MNKKQALAIGGVAAASLLMAFPAFAETTTPTTTGQHPSHFAGKGSTSAGRKGAHQQLTNATFGTVASVDGSTFTITRKTREATTTVTVTTNSATTYKKNGQPDASTDLAVGQRVVVMGTKDSSGNVADATSVSIMVRGPKPTTTTQS